MKCSAMISDDCRKVGIAVHDGNFIKTGHVPNTRTNSVNGIVAYDFYCQPCVLKRAEEQETDKPLPADW